MHRVSVLDLGWVELLELSGGDDAIVEAALECTGRDTTNSKARLIETAMLRGHTSIFEHATVRLRVKCPLFVARQWMRHRTWTFSERSLRFCTAKREYYIPGIEDPELREYVVQVVRRERPPQESTPEITPALWAYVGQMEHAFSVYEQLVNVYHWPKEQARGVLGTAVYTQFYASTDVHNLMHWMRLRQAKDAQYEHREYAHAVYTLLAERMPLTMSAFRRLRTKSELADE